MMHDSPPTLTEQRDFFLTSSLRATAGARFLLKGVANHAKKDRISAKSRGGFKIR